MQPIKFEPQRGLLCVPMNLESNQTINTLPVHEECVHSGAGRDNQLDNHLETEKAKKLHRQQSGITLKRIEQH